MISIIELLLTAIMTVLKLPLALIPTFHFPPDMLSAISSGFDLINGLGFFIPLSTIAQAGVLLIVVYNIEFIWGIFNFAYTKIRHG